MFNVLSHLPGAVYREPKREEKGDDRFSLQDASVTPYNRD